MLGKIIHKSSSHKMSQKRITKFFSPNQNKRKCDIEVESSVCSKVPKLNTSEKLSSVNIQSVRSRIHVLAAINKALHPNIGTTWFQELENEFSKDYFKKLGEFLRVENSRSKIYPPAADIYSWTKSVEIYNIKVVILGQDPYIREGQAHGLAFSVRKNVAIPKSLVNIYQELLKDIPGFILPTHGCLNGWASQGVLLLNTCLTVRAGVSDSHKGKGWEEFTDAVIKWIDQHLSHIVFILWGNNAKQKEKLITKAKNHLVLTAAHPSPLSASRGFFGCRHFSKTNEYLKSHNKQPIDWKYLP